MERPIAACDTPNDRAYSGSTGTTLPKPNWLIPISTHIQTRIRTSSSRGRVTVRARVSRKCRAAQARLRGTTVRAQRSAVVLRGGGIDHARGAPLLGDSPGGRA